MKKNHQRGFTANKDSERYAGSPMGMASRYSALADLTETAGWGGDNSNGHRGHAKAKRGGKKFVNSRIRFHEKAAVRRLPTDDAA